MYKHTHSSVIIARVCLCSFSKAIFEIITSEATYHLNLTTLIDQFMDDPKMDSTVPESVLDRTQHSMIFSNVREIRRVSARYSVTHFMSQYSEYSGTSLSIRGHLTNRHLFQPQVSHWRISTSEMRTLSSAPLVS